MRALVTGGAGFLGSHHCEKLLSNGWDVVCFDNKATGRSGNVQHLENDGRLEFIRADVSSGLPCSSALD